MVALKNIQTRFSIPIDFNEEQRFQVAQLIIEKIQENTSQGKNRYGSSMPKYSEEYKQSLDFKNAGKGSLPNLHLSGDMLASIELISDKPGEVVIGYKAGDSLAGQVEGNVIGSYGGNPDPSHARPFIGLPQKQLDLIIAKVRSETESLTTLSTFTGSLLANLLNKLG